MNIRFSILFILLACSTVPASSQTTWSEKMSATAMKLWPDSMALKPGQPAKWTYDQGLLLKGIEKVWQRTGNGMYFRYIQKSMDFYVGKDGAIRTYKQADDNLDNITPGRNLLLLYDVLEDEKYRKAAAVLREQLASQPRTKEGGFWHKKIYPYQMWLDGLYMAEPFYAEYAARFHEPAAFNDIADQFIWMEQHARDPQTGLLCHAWNENKSEQWADKITGRSPNCWGRAMGWYGMALVDVLDILPAGHPKREALLAILKRYIDAVKKVQDKNSGVWWQVLDKGNEKGNYLEASASCMFVYTIAKAVQFGYINAGEFAYARKGYDGIIKTFVSTDSKGQVNLDHVCQVAGLGGNPYRDGSYQYYIHEPVVTNDPKGMGAFILAAAAMETMSDITNGPGKGKQVVLDYYFNNERRKNKEGDMARFHYTWEDRMNSGFSLWGSVFRDNGAQTLSLETAPDEAHLKNASVYIIADPDIPKENPSPDYIEPEQVKAISNWVKEGGVLVLMGNDTGNAEFDHFNKLAGVFGIQFNKDSRNHVTGTQFDMGKLSTGAGNPIFTTAKNIYIKELATLAVKAPAKSNLSDNGDVIFATAKFGKGTVFAVGDPWLYNEYTDGRKLPSGYQNFEAAKDLAKWLLLQARAK